MNILLSTAPQRTLLALLTAALLLPLCRLRAQDADIPIAPAAPPQEHAEAAEEKVPEPVAEAIGEKADEPVAKPARKPKRDLFQELDPDNEISIAANRVEIHINDRYTELSGNVMIRTSVIALTAEKLRIFADEDNHPDKIEAESRVALRKLDGTESATGDRAEFVRDTNLIVLDGDCTLMRGSNIMRCKRIFYDINRQTVTAEGGSLILPNIHRQIEIRRQEDEEKPTEATDKPADRPIEKPAEAAEAKAE